MTTTDHIEAIAAEIEIARDARLLRDDQLKTIKRHLDGIRMFGGKTDLRGRFEAALHAHLGSNARGTLKISEACYAAVVAHWKDLLQRFEAEATQ